MGPLHPIFIDLTGHPVVIVGGGALAERKIEALLQAGARLTVVSPEQTPKIRRWGDAGRLVLKARRYKAGDLRGFRLAYAVTADAAVNRAVRVEARAEGIWLDVIDRPDLCDFMSPVTVRHGHPQRPGGPEVMALHQAGVRPELVFLTGYRRVTNRSPVDWRRYARSPASLVIFMGLHTLSAIVRDLLAHGRDPQSPVTVIENGALRARRTLVGPLVQIADLAAERGIQPPALVVIGEVGFRDRLAVFQPAEAAD